MKPVSRLFPLALMALALAGCQQGKAPEPAPSDGAAGPTVTGQSASAAPETKPGLALADGQFALPAVKGNPGAAYFTLTNRSAKPVVIAAVDVAGAGMAMLHQNASASGGSTMEMMENPEVKPGAALVFKPGGNHVMVDDVPDDWKPGASVELTLTFADGDKLSAPLTVVAPGRAN